MNKKLKIGISIGVILILSLIIVLYVFLKPKNYTVTFDSNGGSSVEKQIVEKNEKAVKPIDPTRDGYEFDGWYLDDEKYYFDSEVTKNITLEARWSEKTNVSTVTITFDTVGGSTINSKTIESGTKLEKPTDPVKDGYVFVEWLLNNNSFNFDNEVVSDITLVASYKKLEENSFVITFNSNGGSSVATQTVKSGEKISKPANPTKSGYTFNGWYLNDKKFDFNTSITSNITLVAKWTKNQTTESTQNQTTESTQTVTKYTVSFNSNGGSSIASQTITAGAKATKPANPTRDGYKFIGWMHNGGAYNFDSAVNSNIILVAEWEIIPVPDVYTVSLDTIDGDINSPERKAIVYKNGSVITAKQLLDGDSVIGKYVSSLGAIRVNKASYDNATSLKVKLEDGSVVSATKN